MNKTPISIALERQIPEFIREDYDLFVKFIKAYYAFLEETQQRNLEDVRSVENTLDEFIVKFKKELAIVFPTNTLENERFILQRMQEFYMTRGSIESFQFLFRSIFNRDATIYYPSQQILRASDGKWTQETSVFVKQSSGDLDKLSGKIIKIITDKKHIDVFCTKVIYYRDDIYEVFIDRKYIADIEVGNQVSLDSNAGDIVPCPSKYTIVNEGKGFSVGSIYNLQSEKGTGSTVKITKIGTNGEIKKIQIISFGLDYESNFYAKLSNKTPQAIPYYHPIRAPGVNALLNPYAEPGLGYVDYGYINSQTYFYYDTNYTNVDSTQQYFYADGSYVGEVIGSFYTNASGVLIDEDTAEIKIELGAVAVYPGFYQKNDGFISDEIYIQDGKYYQLFSYVIKVEEQLDKYKNLVLSLLHPAGLELFAEYTIRNDFQLSATPLLAFIRRQFLDSEFTADTSYIDDYKFVDDITFATVLNTVLDVVKVLSDTYDTTDYRYNDVSKIVLPTDSTASTSFTRYNDIELVKLEDQTTTDASVYLLTSSKTDSSLLVDYRYNDVSKVVLPTDSIVSTSFTRYNDVSKVVLPTDSTVSTSFTRYNDVQLVKLEDQAASDISLYSLTIGKTDSTLPVDIETSEFGLNKTDTASTSFTLLNSVSLSKPETTTITDLISFGLGGSSYNKIVSTTDTLQSTIQYVRSFGDSVTTADLAFLGYLYNDVTSTPTDSITLTTSYVRSINDSTSTTHSALDFAISGASFAEGINNSNTGLLYVSPYNQDGETQYFSYFSEVYVAIDSRALT